MASLFSKYRSVSSSGGSRATVHVAGSSNEFRFEWSFSDVQAGKVKLAAVLCAALQQQIECPVPPDTLTCIKRLELSSTLPATRDFLVFGFEHLQGLSTLILNEEAIDASLIESCLQTTLTELDIQGHRLSELPPGLSNLVNLTRLTISKNNISSLSMEVLSPLTSLTVLDVSGNKLTEVPRDILTVLPALEVLNLQNNRIKVPIFHLRQPGLRTLLLGQNPLEYVPPLQSLTRLSNLSLGSVRVVQTNQSEEGEIDAFEALPVIVDILGRTTGQGILPLTKDLQKMLSQFLLLALKSTASFHPLVVAAVAHICSQAEGYRAMVASLPDVSLRLISMLDFAPPLSLQACVALAKMASEEATAFSVIENGGLSRLLMSLDTSTSPLHKSFILQLLSRLAHVSDAVSARLLSLSSTAPRRSSLISTIATAVPSTDGPATLSSSPIPPPFTPEKSKSPVLTPILPPSDGVVSDINSGATPVVVEVGSSTETSEQESQPPKISSAAAVIELRLLDLLETFICNSGEDPDFLKSRALRLLGDLCLFRDNRTLVLSRPLLVDSLLKLGSAAFSEKDSTVSMCTALRTIAILGLSGSIRTPRSSVPPKAVRILCVDGGGVKGIVPLRILQALEKRCGKKTHELFDMIGGTSAGGMLAAGLALGRSAVEMDEVYLSMVSAAFSVVANPDAVTGGGSSTSGGNSSNSNATANSNSGNPSSGANNSTSAASGSTETGSSVWISNRVESRNLVSMLERTKAAAVSLGRLVVSGAKYEHGPLEKAIKKAIDVKLHERDLTELATVIHSPKLFLTTSLVSVRPLQPFVFRSYNLPPGTVTTYRGTCRYELAQAVRASSAAPFYFEDCVWRIPGAPLDQFHRFQDGALCVNNPALVGVHEAMKLWGGSAKIECLLSLGTGEVPEMPRMGQMRLIDVFGDIMVESATSVDRVHEALSLLMSPSNNYFRLSIVDERCDMYIDDMSPSSLQRLQLAITDYLEENSALLDRIAEFLCKDEEGTATPVPQPPSLHVIIIGGSSTISSLSNNNDAAGSSSHVVGNLHVQKLSTALKSNGAVVTLMADDSGVSLEDSPSLPLPPAPLHLMLATDGSSLAVEWTADAIALDTQSVIRTLECLEDRSNLTVFDSLPHLDDQSVAPLLPSISNLPISPWKKWTYLSSSVVALPKSSKSFHLFQEMTATTVLDPITISQQSIFKGRVVVVDSPVADDGLGDAIIAAGASAVLIPTRPLSDTERQYRFQEFYHELSRNKPAEVAALAANVLSVPSLVTNESKSVNIASDSPLQLLRPNGPQ